MQVTIAGSGGWGTALAILLHENGHDVTLWSHFETESKQLAETHQNPYLPGVTLPEGLHYSADPACAQGKEMVVFATPSFAVRTTARAFAPYLAETPLLVSVTKGIEEGTGYRMSELVSQETGRTVVALSGPSHAEEVSRGIPTGVVVACPERELAERVQNAFMCSRFRVYTSPDTAGIELGAALKNVIALCAGVCDGMGYGDNTKALLMTRGLAEVARLGMALGAHRETFAGLAGVGDLIVTCTSMHSRNRRAGILIGQGVPGLFVSIFSSDPQVGELAVRAIRIYTLGVIPLAVQYTVIDGFTGMGMMQYSLPLSFFRKAIYFIPLFVLPMYFGAMSTFVAEPISDFVAPVVSAFVYWRRIRYVVGLKPKKAQ